MGHAIVERVLLFGTRSADYIRASGHSGCIEMEVSPPFENRPYTWLHPNASQISQIPLAPRAPSIHGPSLHFSPATMDRRFRGKADITGIVPIPAESALCGYRLNATTLPALGAAQ